MILGVFRRHRDYEFDFDDWLITGSLTGVLGGGLLRAFVRGETGKRDELAQHLKQHLYYRICK